MADEEEDKKYKEADGNEAKAAAGTPLRAEHPHASATDKSKETHGERVYKGLLFAFNWVLTFGLTVGIAFAMQETKWGNKLHAHHDEKLLKLTKSEWLTKQAWNTNILSMGGNIMALVTLPLMRAKDRIVAYFNKNESPEKAQAAQERIAEEGKPGAWDVIRSRVIAYLTVLVSFTALSRVFPETFNAFENEFGVRVAQLLKKPTHIGGVPTKTFAAGKLGALDVIATTASVALLLAFTPIFSAMGAKKKHRTTRAESAASTPASAPESTVPDNTEPATPPQKSFAAQLPAPESSLAETALRRKSEAASAPAL